MNREIKTKDAERVRKPKLPKKRLLKKPKSLRAYNGAESAESKHKAGRQNMKFCPKCGSANIFWASGLPQLWSVWECRNCGYRGALILEDGKLAEKLREEYARKITKN